MALQTRPATDNGQHTPRPSAKLKRIVPKAQPAQTAIEQRQQALLGENYAKIAGLKKSLRMWRVIAAVAIVALLAIASFHANLWVNGPTKTATSSAAKNTATQEAVVALSVGSNDKSASSQVSQKKTVVAPAATKSAYASADKKVKLAITYSGAGLEVTGHILNDDEFVVIGIDPESKKPFDIEEGERRFLNKRTFTGTWRPVYTVARGVIVQIKKIGTKDPICEAAITH